MPRKSWTAKRKGNPGPATAVRMYVKGIIVPAERRPAKGVSSLVVSLLICRPLPGGVVGVIRHQDEAAPPAAFGLDGGRVRSLLGPLEVIHRGGFGGHPSGPDRTAAGSRSPAR